MANYLSPLGWWRSEDAKQPLLSLQREIDRMFKDFVDRMDWPAPLSTASGSTVVAPKMDVVETDQAYELSVDMPGIDDKDLAVSVADGVLTIKGEKRFAKDEKDEKKNIIRVERTYGGFQRSLALPGDVDEQKIAASYVNGVLKVTIPKSEKAAKAARKIAISAGNGSKSGTEG